MKISISLIITITIQFITLTHSFASFEQTPITKPVAVIINSELYPQVKDSIDRYLDDLKNEGYSVLFSEWDNKVQPDIEELRTLLRKYHQKQNLQGAVLIGQLPYARGEIDHHQGPIEIYLMDTNSENFIKNNNGNITSHKGPINLDIWVSRIWAPGEPRLLLSEISEADLIKKYFKKNHNYRTCQSPVPDLKIIFFGDDEYTNIFIKVTEYLNSWKNFYSYLVESGYPQEYLELVKDNPAQYLYTKSHSSNEFHTFEFSGQWNLYSSRSINNNAHIKQPFIFLDACSACAFSNPESLGNAYLFGPHSSALVIAGLTVPGNLMDISLLHSDSNNFASNAILNFNAHGKTTVSTIVFGGAAILTAGAAILQQDLSIIPKAIAFIFGLELVKYNHKDWIISFSDSRSFGFTLLGDPTLKPYIDMGWCPEYDSNSKEKL